MVPPQLGTATSLTYAPPAGVVAEFHSHGTSRAFFSKTDDRDEQGFRIYGVARRLDATEPELSLRVGVYGHFAPVEWFQSLFSWSEFMAEPVKPKRRNGKPQHASISMFEWAMEQEREKETVSAGR